MRADLDGTQFVYPTPKTVRYNRLMTVALASFTFALFQALGIHDRIMARDGLILRPLFSSKAVAARLRAGVRALAAYLRRVLVLMALEIESELVVVKQPENLARAKAKMARLKRFSLRIYPPDTNNRQAFFEQALFQGHPVSSVAHDATCPPLIVPIGCWLDRLDHLHAIAKDPQAKARRLAFTLARSRHGILMAPDETPPKLHRWGTEASALFDVMAMQIIDKSRRRPPPLPPPRRGPKPMITVL